MVVDPPVPAKAMAAVPRIPVTDDRIFASHYDFAFCPDFFSTQRHVAATGVIIDGP